MVREWRRMKIFQCFTCQTFVEPHDSYRFEETFQGYLCAVKNEGRAIFFGVCRGKFAEGIDFPDAAARAVFLVSIPYP